MILSLSLLLGLAGCSKLRAPGPATRAFAAAGVPFSGAAVRLVAICELSVATAGLLAPEPLAGGVVAGTLACLGIGAGFAAPRLRMHPCGCFGEADGRLLGWRQIATNLLASALVALAAATEPEGLPRLVSHRPAVAAAMVACSMALALGLREWLRGGSGLDTAATRLVGASARVLEARLDRRAALTRIAVAGSALAIAPLRYLLYPGTALAAVLPSSCSTGLCTDGYTAFCCELDKGLNRCPPGTFAGGWWMCTDYRGSQLCRGTGVRYYVDCNALPGHPFPGGCRCANGSCANRKQACNVFRYGQCNTQIKGTTAVVCRMVTCENPSRIDALHCSPSLMVDNAVCGHEAGCLEPAAVQLPGTGGA